MSSRFVLALAGGVGGGKFARGLTAVLPPDQLAIVVNTADDFVHLGLHISPDVDSVLYAVAGLNDLERGWGLAGETWNFMNTLRRLAAPDWFQLGDRDLATHVLRTEALAAGQSLSEVTAMLAERMGIAHTVAPMTDQAIRSVVDTDEGALPFQDYFVKRQCQPAFRGVKFQGVESARPSAALDEALQKTTAILIAPSNPYRQHRSDPVGARRAGEDTPLAGAGRRGLADRGRRGDQGAACQDDARAWPRAVDV